MQESWVRSLGQEDPLEKEMATHSSILTKRIPWTEEPGGLQFMGSQRVRHDWVTNTFLYFSNWWGNLGSEPSAPRFQYRFIGLQSLCSWQEYHAADSEIFQNHSIKKDAELFKSPSLKGMHHSNHNILFNSYLWLFNPGKFEWLSVLIHKTKITSHHLNFPY